MCPVIAAFRGARGEFSTVVVVTAQHRHMLDQVLDVFDVKPDHDLDIMVAHQSLNYVLASAATGLHRVYSEIRPDLVFVQGDTTSTFAGAISAFYDRIPVAHIEAGLRTHDRWQPFPEEINRQLTTAVTDLNFAPTEWSRDNLLREGVPAGSIHVTGNTAIDALFHVLDRPFEIPDDIDRLAPENDGKTILVTIHRRENHGPPLSAICTALLELSHAFEDARFLIPVHPNPDVRTAIERALGGGRRMHLLPPLDYRTFAHLMKRSYLILTDSGGIQEEAPSLGKPVLVLREKTERPEGVTAGTVKLVGTDTATIVREAARLLEDRSEYAAMARRVNPYGDGKASGRIVSAVRAHFGLAS